ncbi:chaperone clpb, partial [Striga asiatica]
MLDNIENAHSCCDEVLVHLLKDGRVIGENGVHVDFSHDILIVSSHVGHQFLFHCRCLHETLPKIPFRKILKEPTLVHRGMHLDPGKAFDGCDIHRFYVEVAQRFRAEFVDLFDDVVVFPRMRPWDYYTIFWLQHREAAMRMTSSHKLPVIMYPTDAALSYMTTWPDMFEGKSHELDNTKVRLPNSIQGQKCHYRYLLVVPRGGHSYTEIDRAKGKGFRGAHAYETWYEAHKVQMLNRDILEKVTNKTIIIYIDTFLGSWEYSFRVETISHLEEHPAFKILKESIRHLRSKYRRERQQVNKIYMVLASYFRLLEQINSKSETNDANIRKLSEEIVILIDEVVKFEKIQVEDFFEKCSPSEQTRIQSSEWLKLVSTKLQTLLVLEDRATRGIIEVLLSQLNNGDPSPKSFLCLGLKPNSLEQYAKSLAQQLVIDDGEKLMIQVDLSLCTGPESFFRCSDIGNPHLLLMEFVKKSPYSVIVFYELEKAHIATFSIILSILEGGVTKDKDGNIVDFSNSVIVIVSHLGNKEMIGWFNGHHTKIELCGKHIFLKSTPKPVDGFSTSLPGEKGLIGLRTELLNRLDFMLLFDPFCEEQLNAFAKVGMKHLRDGDDGRASLSVAFRNLFKAADGNKRPSYTTHDMLKTIIPVWLILGHWKQLSNHIRVISFWVE